MVDQINVNLGTKQIKITLMPDAARYILEKTCGDRSYGARPLRRALQKYIEDPLSEALIQGSLPRPADLEVFLSDTGICCRPVRNQTEELVAVGGGAEETPEPAPSISLYTF
jgi:ATP-dependent Clp protease ATP-binding subunit ClpC